MLPLISSSPSTLTQFRRCYLLGLLSTLALLTPGCAQPVPTPTPKAAPNGPTTIVGQPFYGMPNFSSIKIPDNIKPEDVSRYVIEQSRKQRRAAEEQQASAAFEPLMEILERSGEYPRIISESKKHTLTAPQDGAGYFYLGLGNYYDGDFTAALVAWKRAKQLDETLLVRIAPLEARASRILRRFPGLKLGSVRLVESDFYTEAIVPYRLGKKLLQERNYNEIERVVQKLQRENQIGLDGHSSLSSFMNGLEYQDEPSRDETPDLKWQRSWERIQQWKKAKPSSVAASVAQIEVQTRWASYARGTAYADEVTQEQWAGMNQHLAEAEKVVVKLSPAAMKFPLTGSELLGWALFSDLPDSESRAIWTDFNRQFPGSLELAENYCIKLLPRWGGGPGEWEKLATAWANQAPGEAGDIRYAQLMISMWAYFGKSHPFWAENNLDWPRARRGLKAMVKKHPQSLSAATALMQLATDKGDWATAQNALIHQVNNRANTSLFKSKREFALYRLHILEPGH